MSKMSLLKHIETINLILIFFYKINMSKKQYWRGLEELNPTEEFKKAQLKEFHEELPFEEMRNLANAPTSRRDFLKYLGFTTAAATVAASCEMQVRKAIPYAIKPENVTPGVPLMFASTFVDGGSAIPVLVKTREGRPIKIEGNPDSKLATGNPTPHGFTSARIQGSVLNLYDAARLKFPYIDNKESTWEAVDKKVIDTIKSLGTSPLYIISSTINSESTLHAISQFIAKYPNTKHVMYDAISYSGILDANLASFGQRAIPTYRFDNAKVIISIGADFLSSWISPEIFSAQYSLGRKISAKNLSMSKHYQFEGMMSLTGSNADERVTCLPSQYGTIAIALYNALTGGANETISPTVDAMIKKATKDLETNKGNALVVCGSNDTNVQAVVNAINNAIGAYGATISYSATNNAKKGNDTEMNAFAEALKSGQVGGVLFYDCNPVYDNINGKTIAENLSKLKLSVSFNDRMDETTQKCKIAAPTNHWLESWGDANPQTGYISFIQPTINPLFKTRPWEQSLMKWAEISTSHDEFIKTYWISKLGNQHAFDQALQIGIIEPATATMSGSNFSGNIATSIDAIKSNKAASGKVELVIYEKIGIGHGGAWSNNPWLQEMPDPVSKCTWDNYILMSPKRAKDMGAEWTDLNEVQRKKKVFNIKANNTELKLPVLVLPGMHDDVIAIAVGYGRDKGVGMAAANTGGNVYPFVGKTSSGHPNYLIGNVEITPTKDLYELAITQTHFVYQSDRHSIIHEFTLEEFKKNPNELYDERKEELGHFTHSFEETGGHGAHGEANSTHAKTESDWQEAYRKNGTLYPNHEALGLKWGMSIDLSTCIGCGSCTIACQAENNISVVGKSEVLLVHDMHWLRIDRYFSGDPYKSDSVQTLFQPMLCQHCDNAPCENVCPVNATNHSSEGLNQMAYNRCIGTRYCANNCPYKVRRFNWKDWNEADSFADNAYSDGRRDDMNDNITRMVLNPDVTVRSRGVMEKCSFCVQRLQSAKDTAKKQGRVLKDGEATIACQTACPTNAIVFGNVNDRESEIYKLRYEEQKERVFHVLEEIHTLPNINYLSKIRNADVLQSVDPERTHEVKNEHA